MTVRREEGNLAGSMLAVDQAFILRMLLPAFAAAGVDPDICRVAHALSIGEACVFTGIAAL